LPPHSSTQFNASEVDHAQQVLLFVIDKKLSSRTDISAQFNEVHKVGSCIESKSEQLYVLQRKDEYRETRVLELGNQFIAVKGWCVLGKNNDSVSVRILCRVEFKRSIDLVGGIGRQWGEDPDQRLADLISVSPLIRAHTLTSISLAQFCQQLSGMDRLGKDLKVIVPRPRIFEQICCCRLPGEEHNLAGGQFGDYFNGSFNSGDPRHDYIGNQHIGLENSGYLERLFSAVDGLRLKACLIQDDCKRIGDHLLVIGNKHLGLVVLDHISPVT
jgi:hypothetical protein